MLVDSFKKDSFKDSFKDFSLENRGQLSECSSSYSLTGLALTRLIAMKSFKVISYQT